MSQINELIEKLCPNGVEWKTLGEVLKYEQPTKYIVESNDYSNEGTPVLTAGATFLLGYTEEINGIYTASKDNPVIIFDDFTTSFHWVDFDFKVKSSAMKMLKPINKKVNFRYVYYSMCEIKYIPVEHSRQWIGTYSQFPIPLPPLEIQNRIVEILDHFTDLTTNLTAELNLRRKQFEHYREKLLSLDGVDGVEWKTLGEVAEITDYVANGSFASLRDNVEYKRTPDFAALIRTFDFSTNFDRKQMIYIDEKAYNFLGKSKLFGGEIIINNVGAGVGNSFICPYLNIKMSLAPNSVLLRTQNNKYFFYWLNTNNGKSAISKIVSKSALPKFNKTGLRGVLVPVPPLAVQQSIVAKLDKFTALIQNIENELALRQKQYEYYREKLLSFPSPSL